MLQNTVLFLYRIRGVMLAIAVLILLGFALFGTLLPSSMHWFPEIVAPVAIFMMVLSVILSLIGPRFLPDRKTMVVRSPVRGRWQALNSPTSKVPSHGVHAYGQTYAIDLVYEPTDQPRPEFGSGPAMQQPAEYPAFGQPVEAMIDGTVVRASDWRRDHKSRSSYVAVAYMMLEGAIRELGGPGFVLGNHVVIRGAHDTYAVVAHLQQGSLHVRTGDTVHAGQRLGSCGNSGNSSEPHVHAQIMDRKSSSVAVGIPMSFANITLDDEPGGDFNLPINGQYMHATDKRSPA